MNKKALSFFFFGICIFLSMLAGCASGPSGAPPPLRREYGLNRSGYREFMKGDYAGAIGYYSRALRQARTMENHSGEAVNLIDMAAAYRKAGDAKNALGCLDEILLDGGAYPGWSRAQAGYLKALLLADSGESGGGAGPAVYDAARFWAGKALSYCQGGCDARGRIMNLMARLALARKDPAMASMYAQKALPANRENKDLAEEANSLRMEADARAMEGRYAGAVRLYGLALAGDKGLGLGRKMALDLLGMGNACCAVKETGRGTGYLERALAITRALGPKKSKKTGLAIAEGIKGCGR